MTITKSIRENLQFLIAEVSSQVINLIDYLDSPSPLLAQKIVERRGYTHNLKNQIHDSCLREISQTSHNEKEALIIRAFEFVATDLERVSELCRDSVKQMERIEDKKNINLEDYEPLLERIIGGMDLIDIAILGNDTKQALKIGQVERKLDPAYKKLFRKYTNDLKRKNNTEDLISVLFVAHNIEQMGDALLNISESILSANLGQAINIDRYHSLEASLSQLGETQENGDLSLKSIAETRSGSGISGITSSNERDDGYVAIFKDGEKRKLKEERKGVESWHEIYPGLAPKILSYHKQGNSASLLIEHLAGLTFEQILLHEPLDLLNEALNMLSGTLKSVWHETKKNKSIPAGFMQQLAKRLDDVYTIHPEFYGSDSEICGFKSLSFDNLLEQARQYEQQLSAPFSVHIHGDFNLDNIIYDPQEKRINFIDLHRSRYMDYVQDVSVFMVSNYRLQVLDKNLRKRIMVLVYDFYKFASQYAKKAGDETFELRLALGLARSFATSTRFILDQSLASAMFQRAYYLIELVLATDLKKAKKFKVPVKEIFVG